MKDFLDQLLTSLCSIEVKGKDNLNVLLGCILATEQMIATLGKEADDAEPQNDNG